MKSKQTRKKRDIENSKASRKQVKQARRARPSSEPTAAVKTLDPPEMRHSGLKTLDLN